MRELFIMASCLELAMGMLDMCKYELPGKRYILWGFFLIYLLVALRRKYSNREIIILIISIALEGVLYCNTGINTGIKAPVYIFALKEMDIPKVFRWLLITMLMMFAIIFTMALLFDFGTLYINDVR